MSLTKSIKNGRERRKPYYDSRSFDHSCRNNGTCSACFDNRTIANKKRLMKSEIDQEF